MKTTIPKSRKSKTEFSSPLALDLSDFAVSEDSPNNSHSVQFPSTSTSLSSSPSPSQSIYYLSAQGHVTEALGPIPDDARMWARENGEGWYPITEARRQGLAVGVVNTNKVKKGPAKVKVGKDKERSRER